MGFKNVALPSHQVRGLGTGYDWRFHLSSYMVRAGGAECRDVVKHPLVPAGTGPILPQMRARNMGYPEGAG